MLHACVRVYEYVFMCVRVCLNLFLCVFLCVRECTGTIQQANKIGGSIWGSDRGGGGTQKRLGKQEERLTIAGITLCVTLNPRLSQLQVSPSILVTCVTFNPCLCVTLNPRLSQLQVSLSILLTVSLSILVTVSPSILVTHGLTLNPRLSSLVSHLCLVCCVW